jgi:ABC-2 type transport system ATP-binding protein
MIFGKDSRDYHSRAAVGFLPENPYFYKFLTAAETLRFYGNVCGLRGAPLNKRIDELLALVGLEEAHDRRIGGFSKGMLQRIGLAQALVQDPLLVVLDEPTAGVDPAGSHQIRDLILDLKKRGKTVLLTSHLLEQVQEICDRVGIMARGEMIREGALEDLVSVKNQTEFIIENLSPEVRLQIEQLVQKSGSNLLSSRQPQRSLESVFLELTATQPHGSK